MRSRLPVGGTRANFEQFARVLNIFRNGGKKHLSGDITVSLRSFAFDSVLNVA